MAIVEMTKFNLIIPSKARTSVLETMQQFNYIHFLDLLENEKLEPLNLSEMTLDEEMHTIEERIRQVSAAIDVLKKYEKSNHSRPWKEGPTTFEFNQLKRRAQNFDFDEFHRQLTELLTKQESITKEKKTLQDELTELKPWLGLGIAPDSLKELRQCRVTLGTISKKLQPGFVERLSKLKYTHVITMKEKELDVYMLIITHKVDRLKVRKIMQDYGFSTIELSDYTNHPEDAITKLKKTIEKLETDEEKVETQLTILANRMDDLKLLYDYYRLVHKRIAASGNFLHTDWYTILEGYIPTKMERKFEKMLVKLLDEDYHLEMEKVDEADPSVPVLLENNTFFQPFEAVTEMYAVPKYNEIDPTPWFTLFFTLFFGIMVGDAGYGMLLLLASTVILKFFKLKKKQRNFIRFFHYLSYSMILWGLIFGSFFGGVVPLPALIDATEEYNLLLTLSIALGGIHIFFALAIKGYMHLKKGKILDAVYDVLFWYMAVAGGIAYLLTIIMPLSGTVEKTSLTIMIIGMVGILLTGGRENKTLGGKIAGGLYELYGITGYVGDFVSYSRLMALALSSAFIAFAINMMVGMLFEFGVIGIVVGIIVFVVGQGFNLFLSMLSGYVHTLRLTYVEFFGKFYEGGGKRFETLRGEAKYIEVK